MLFHEVVEVRQWLNGLTLLNGIALGQVTPGPIVITATFIGYLLKGPLGGPPVYFCILLRWLLELLLTLSGCVGFSVDPLALHISDAYSE